MEREKYSVENIYVLFGQYDLSATFFFEEESEAFNKFGPSVTGIVAYTFEERKKLEEITSNKNYKNSQGIVRLEYHLNDRDADYISELRFRGFSTSDIRHIDYLRWKKVNRFTNDDTDKSVPYVQEIPISEIPNFEKIKIENLKLRMFENRFNRGAALLYEEKCEYVGILLALLRGKIPKGVEEFSGLSIEDIRNNKIVLRNYLKIKGNREELTLEEKSTLLYLDMMHVNENLKAFDEELKLAFGKEFDLTKHEQLYQFVRDEVAKFEKERLLQIKCMVYWDVKGFCHTYLRHVKETKVGGKSAEKSTIPYKYEEIKRLIQKVLSHIQDEIKTHFMNNADKKFKRVGSRAVYFHGDYFNIVIDVDGRLESFYSKDRHFQPGLAT